MLKTLNHLTTFPLSPTTNLKKTTKHFIMSLKNDNFYKKDKKQLFNDKKTPFYKMNIYTNNPLATYTPSENMPWNSMRVQHLYRRAGFGATPEMIEAGLKISPSELIDQLLEKVLNQEHMADPGWGYLNYGELIEKYGDTRTDIGLKKLENNFFNLMLNNGLYARMLFFWHDHFATEEREVRIPSYTFQKYILIQKNLLGNFKDFTYKIGLTPEMLMYLNGYSNTKNSPNENYARELYELFTLGVNNGYTEKDTEETAKALTGYNTTDSTWGNIIFNERSSFDNSDKTIFGETGNWNYEDVINILFEKRKDEIATYICTKLYKYFIDDTINLSTIEELSKIFIEHNFDIEIIVRTLLKSNIFFDKNSIGKLIKSPIDLIFQLQTELSINLINNNDESDETIQRLLKGLKIELFTPPNVSGWPEHKQWITTNSVIDRNLTCYKILNNHKDLLMSFFKKHNVDEIDKSIKNTANFLLATPLYFKEEYIPLIDSFKQGVPKEYFEDGTWDLEYHDLDQQVFNLLNAIQRLPEFQLR